MKEIGLDNFQIKLLEEIDTDNKQLAKHRERYYIELYDTINNGYNSILSIITMDERNNKIKEYRTTHKTYHRYKFLEYCNRNMDKINMPILCNECGHTYLYFSKTGHLR